LSNTEDKPAQDSVDVVGKNALVENEMLKTKVAELTAQLDATKKGLAKALDMQEQQEKARMVPLILANTNLTKEEVMAMDTPSMFDLTETFRILKHSPMAASVRPGNDDEEQDVRSTIRNKFKYSKDRKEA